MRVVVITGGRDYLNEKKVFDALDFMRPDHVVEGGCPTGADAFARKWALKNKVSNHTIHAEWDVHGKSAGPLRNKKMLELYPSAAVVAFTGGRGTANCVDTANKMKMLVVKVER